MYKFSSFVLFLIFTATLVAQTAVPPAAGSGTENDPYQIESLENLYWIAADNDIVPDPDQTTRWQSHYIQIADIDATDTENWFDGTGWKPIGHYTFISEPMPFSGLYDGQNYNIDGLYISHLNDESIGFFGYSNNALIMNVEIINAEITALGRIGILIGYNYDSTVDNCSVSGSVIGNTNVGGMIGENRSSVVKNSNSDIVVEGNIQTAGLIGRDHRSWVMQCNSTGTVQGNSIAGGLIAACYESMIHESYSSVVVNGNQTIGGLVGNVNTAIIKESYNTGYVNGSSQVGGLAGSIYRSTIRNCFSTGSVNGNLDSVGGLIGRISSGMIYNSYSTGSVLGEGDSVGGLLGGGYGISAVSSYWNTETSGQDESLGGEGRTTDEMTYPYASNTYVNWDFENIWAADEDYTVNNGYPYLLQAPVSAEDETIIPQTDVALSNYPNPFNPETTISYSLSMQGKVKIDIFNTKGQHIKTLIDTQQNPGEHKIIWDGRDKSGKTVSSGVYFYKLEINGRTKAVDKCLLMK